MLNNKLAPNRKTSFRCYFLASQKLAPNRKFQFRCHDSTSCPAQMHEISTRH